MPTLEQAFNDSKTLPERPDNETLLTLYALYKQATTGNAPEKGDYNMFDFVAKAKHQAWLKLQGITKEDAATEYIALVEKLKNDKS